MGNIFSRGDQVRVAQLHYDNFSLKQPTMTVTQYFTKMRFFFGMNYATFEPSQSVMHLLAHVFPYIFNHTQKYCENYYIITFLQGLNENFANVKY